MPRIVVIVLNWNGREDTLTCLESLRAVEYPNQEVIVVDNGSIDGSVDAVHLSYPDVAVIEVGRNLGFTGGNNVGIEAALQRNPEFILLLNNDTRVASNLLRAFVAAAREYRDAGVFAAKIYLLSDRQRLSYAGGRLNSNSWDVEHVAEGVLDNGVDFEQIHDTDYATGCGMFFRADVARAVGLLDNRFFIFYEDVDWCFRVRKAGFRCLFVPQAKMWHRVSATFSGPKWNLAQYFIIRNRLLWAEKHLPWRQRLDLLSNTLEVVSPIWGILSALRRLLRGRCSARQAYWEARERAMDWLGERGKPSVRAARKAKARALRDYLLRRFGDCPASLRAAATKATHTADR